MPRATKSYTKVERKRWTLSIRFKITCQHKPSVSFLGVMSVHWGGVRIVCHSFPVAINRQEIWLLSCQTHSHRALGIIQWLQICVWCCCHATFLALCCWRSPSSSWSCAFGMSKRTAGINRYDQYKIHQWRWASVLACCWLGRRVIDLRVDLDCRNFVYNCHGRKRILQLM